MHIHIRIIEIILQSIQYRNKELLLELIKAELTSSCSYLTRLAMMVNPKKYHSIHKLFNRVKFDYVVIQIEIIIMIVSFFKIDKISISIDDSIVYRRRKYQEGINSLTMQIKQIVQVMCLDSDG